MIPELMLMSMLMNPDTNKISSAQTIKEQPAVSQTLDENTEEPSYIQLFMISKNLKSIKKDDKKNQKMAENVINDFSSRISDEKQFLKWVELPSNQLEVKNGKSHLDEIYAQALTLKSRKTKTERPLVILGIGGSKHTAEFLLNMNGVGNKGKVYFYSDIDPVSFNNFLKEVSRPVQDLNFLVVSKSGTTFETKDAFVRFEEMLVDYYKKLGQDENQAYKSAQKHFAICTDKTPTEKNLRGKIGLKNGQNNNYIKELYIHDGVGGRFSMFDDAGLFAIAYAGVSKENAKRILKSAEKASKISLSTDLEVNKAMKSAVFNIYSEKNGFHLTQQQYFGKLFEGGGENWIKQLYLESLKDFDFNASKAPDSMHYASESFFFPDNRDDYHVVMTLMNPAISPNYSKYTLAILASYTETVPVKVEVLDVVGNSISPEAIGDYIQTKHFEILYTGMMRRENAKIKQGKYLPEVFQPNVEVYKNKFKPKSPYELKPGI